jgi:hypothetical protein
MTKRARYAMLFGAVLASVGVDVQTAVADNHVSVKVRVENSADVPLGVLAGARSDASRIYRAAGIDIIWVNRDEPACCTGSRVIRVILPSLDGADQYLRSEHVDKNALGEANAAARLVHIFWDRLRSSASQHGRDEAGLLGQVLAHEIGHVLLPGAAHSPTGIMQASLELQTIPVLRFTVEQSETMRSHLRQASDADAETQLSRLQ